MNVAHPKPGGNLDAYLDEIRKFPLLSRDEEQDLARRWRDHGDEAAANRLVNAHLRLVAKVARGYSGYGLPLGELISEGNLGLLHAVKKFDPDRGFRLATYASWWIRASIQEYILHSWSSVKMGTTSTQKKLFFNLRRLKARLEAVDEGDLDPDQVSEIAETLRVPESDVIVMNRRLSGGDRSLNAPLRDESADEWQDRLVDQGADQEASLADREELAHRRRLVAEAVRTLGGRERDILERRHLTERPMTLEQLSQVYGVSRERVRQIETRALRKLERAVKRAATTPRNRSTEPA